MLAPFPWTVGQDPDEREIVGDDAPKYLVLDARGETVADCGIFGRSIDEQERHAAFVALAPKLHMGLKGAAVSLCRDTCAGGTHHPYCKALTRLLDEAAALVGPELVVVEDSQPGRARPAEGADGAWGAQRAARPGVAGIDAGR